MTRSRQTPLNAMLSFVLFPQHGALVGIHKSDLQPDEWRKSPFLHSGTGFFVALSKNVYNTRGNRWSRQARLPKIIC